MTWPRAATRARERGGGLDAFAFAQSAARELARARRHAEPLTMLVFRPSYRDAVAPLATALLSRLRQIDIVSFDDRRNVVAVLLLETTSEQANSCIARLADVLDSHGPLSIGAASFPDDAISWGGLHGLAIEQARTSAHCRREGRPSRARSGFGSARSGVARLTRRAIDVIVVMTTAPVTGPVVVILAIAVKLGSPGPGLISHVRVGEGGRRFRLYKIRTMFEDAELRKQEFAYLNVLSWPDFKIPDDPRVTAMGRRLRKTSLDELPQLWNVLRGDMTLIGPRPCSIPVEHYELWQTERLDVVPGIFGDWQAAGRGVADFRKRSRMDIRQIRTRSLPSDCRLAARTVAGVIRGKGCS